MESKTASNSAEKPEIKLYNHIKSHPIVYVTRDIERALSIPLLGNGGYFIVTNWSKYGNEMFIDFPKNILLIKSEKFLNTAELLDNSEVKDLLNLTAKENGSVLVFKNNSQIEKICTENNWKLLNPNASLAEKIENKISQIDWLGDLSKLLIPFKKELAKNIKWEDKPFVIQWAHGHTGDGTVLIESEKELKDLQKKFPEREAKVTNFIKGSVFTSNISVSDKDTFFGNISYQITGIEPFTDSLFSTIGNDWSVTHSFLDETQIKEYEDIAEKVAMKMRTAGWRGLFGIDVMFDHGSNTLHLLEINARQPASTTYESELQILNRKLSVPGITMFESHLLALFENQKSLLLDSLDSDKSDNSDKKQIILINAGAQIIQRVTNTINENLKVMSDIADQIRLLDFNVIEYSNTEINSDLLRIQCSLGLIKSTNELNERGGSISEIIKAI